MVYTLNKEHPVTVQPQALRTYIAREEPLKCTIWQAARATSAATTFFKPIDIGNPTRTFIDPALGFNNPSEALLSEVNQIWGGISRNVDYKADIGCFLSLGTGFAEVARMDATRLRDKILESFQVPLEAVEVMKAIVTGTEPVTLRLEGLFRYTPIFHRFNVEQGLQAVELFQYEKLSRIQADTDEYLRQREALVIRCVEQMAQIPVLPSSLDIVSSTLSVQTPTATNTDAEEILKQRLNALKMYEAEFIF